MSFAERLWAAVDARGPAMVGLDPRLDRLPEPFAERARMGAKPAAEALVDYHRELLDAVAPHCAAVKPNAAFFEQLGAHGWHALAEAVMAARARRLIVIMDAKRGDIGSTAEAYARAFLRGGFAEAFPASDALTVHPYLGADACRPFLEAADAEGAGLFVLVKTSNPGADLFQEHGTPPLAERVAAAVDAWGESRRDDRGWSSVGAVVGATRPQDLARFRALMPHAPLLLPGFGAQGGTADALGDAFDARGHGAIVNASRSILFAHEREDLQHLPTWQDRCAEAAREMAEQLRRVARPAS